LPAAIVVSFDGEVVGQNWLRWPRNLDLSNPNSIRMFLRLARSASIPLAAPGTFNTGLGECSRLTPEAIIGEWMLDTSGVGLPWKRSREMNWYGAVREALFGWMPGHEAIAAGLVPLEQKKVAPSEIADSIGHLSREFPVQAYELLRGLSDTAGLNGIRPITDQFDRTEVRDERETTLGTLSSDYSITVDSNFIRKLPDDCIRIAGSSDSTDSWRTRAALNLSPLVRRYVGSALLERFI